MRLALLFVLTALLSTCAHAGTISIAWEPVTHVDLAGYRVYYGGAPSIYNQTYDTNLTTSLTFLVDDCVDYYVAVKARGTDGAVSAAYSVEVTGWARPIVSAADPAQVEKNTTLDVVIVGANFMDGAAVQLSDPNIVVNSVVTVDCTSIIANITVPPGAPFTLVDVEVINPDQVFGAGAALFEVLPPGLMPPGQTDRSDKK